MGLEIFIRKDLRDGCAPKVEELREGRLSADPETVIIVFTVRNVSTSVLVTVYLCIYFIESTVNA